MILANAMVAKLRHAGQSPVSFLILISVSHYTHSGQLDINWLFHFHGLYLL
jgi:hypothetical protein